MIKRGWYRYIICTIRNNLPDDINGSKLITTALGITVEDKVGIVVDVLDENWDGVGSAVETRWYKSDRQIIYNFNRVFNSI